MIFILDIDLSYAMEIGIDPPQNEWSEQDFIDDLEKKLRLYLDDLEVDTASTIILTNEDGKTIR